MKLYSKIKWHLKRKYYSTIFFFRFIFYPYITIEGIRIPVDYHWSYSLLDALYHKNYEGGELNILKKTLDKTDKILEIGTGLGLLSSYCARMIGDKNIKTFEANPMLKNHLKKLYKINQISPSYNFALVSDNEGTTDFFLEPSNIWASSILKLSETSQKIELKTIDINNVISEFNPNYLIIDIEGAEYDLLPYINFDHIQKLQIELHTKFLGKEKVSYLINFLTQKGFQQNRHFTTDEQFYFEKK